MTTPWPIGAIGRSNAGIAVMQFKEDALQIHLLDLKGKLLQEIDLSHWGSAAMLKIRCSFQAQALCIRFHNQGSESYL
ncbi:hypothetical protein DPMN_140537 [Dreissena polymorpha]|uniref:Uncharacterized protein n=1 Tax=Dreissena polymorpha TaxID=45954 RepID=A0A9D4GAL6_DREPO|nr:hypothetical protein DPMN_140537 [Dreissena polymorpha]